MDTWKVMNYTVRISDDIYGNVLHEEVIRAEAPWEGITLVQRLFNHGKYNDDAYLEVRGENGELYWDAFGEDIRPVKAKRVKSKKTETYELDDYLIEFTREQKEDGEEWEAWLCRKDCSVKESIQGGYNHKGITVEETYEDFKDTVFKCIDDDIEWYEEDIAKLEED